VHNPLGVREGGDRALDIAFHLSGLFDRCDVGLSTGMIVALSQGRNRKPTSHYR